jgi:hypothetical protein
MAQEAEASRLTNLVSGKPSGEIARAFFVVADVAQDVRYWRKADMAFCTAHVRFWGQSGHQRPSASSRLSAWCPKGQFTSRRVDVKISGLGEHGG